jgi:hypothetical protein
VEASRPTGPVAPAPNGLAFPTDYVDWSPVSATNRVDNHSVRLILGNPVAVRAIAEKRIRPWPDGTAFAKVAWEAKPGPDGAAPRFVQIELMTKDARVHASTQGWGYARWRGDAFVPYGKDASFVEECTGCHAPMRADDFVYTMPIGRGDGSDAWNVEAALAPGAALDPSGWRAIGASFDLPAGTIATTFGDGARRARVTWSQQADRHWFGGRIPGAVRAVEVLPPR